ncbi:hypothetical protein SAMN05444487_101371 [Marininema mesophilum]|uniref:Xylose isomerase-like TIM barrel n=1 Tax=Marininema mesophilum TaxID=1048340 RepID=A0A1H2R432_9BACL|nr:hypothetical protein [Marininema mesophilum]SDW13900.1 hypothetical protein SAMN05444487_101371 [Marininema mesophilum]
MLFTNQMAIRYEPSSQSLSSDPDFQWAEIPLPNTTSVWSTLHDHVQKTEIQPIAFRAPDRFGLGANFPKKEEWIHLFETIAPLFGGRYRFLICHGTTVTLDEVFAYLDARPRDFNALHDYKTNYVEQVIEQLQYLTILAKPYGIHMTIENAPMGGTTYFEPDKGYIHPALRTPRHLLRIVEATEVKLCFDTSYARITSNALSYMRRSRSLFAAATEKEILNAASDWNQFYSQVKSATSLIRLSSSLSWGDTPDTCHIPFTSSTEPELLKFSELVSPKTPIILPFSGDKRKWTEWKTRIKGLKKK